MNFGVIIPLPSVREIKVGYPRCLGTTIYQLPLLIPHFIDGILLADIDSYYSGIVGVATRLAYAVLDDVDTPYWRLVVT